MRNNQIHKDAAIDGASAAAVSEQELELINTYARRQLSAEDVYVFSVVLCDNEVDRDGERFTVESLFALEKLFVGKTGIFDHEPSAKNQTARVFSCSVEAVQGKTTAQGDDYFRLKARAYMPRTEQNSALISAIDSGIVREVSVGCAVKEIRCSVCGEPLAACPHKKGESYGGKLCCGELTEPYDAYEFSFVAVPSQRGAGVVKAYERKDGTMEGIMKKLSLSCGATLEPEECRRLCDYIGELKRSAKDGVYYRDSLLGEVLRLSAAVQPDISRDTMEGLAKEMSVAQLGEFKRAYEKQLEARYSPALQLCPEKRGAENRQFSI